MADEYIMEGEDANHRKYKKEAQYSKNQVPALRHEWLQLQGLAV